MNYALSPGRVFNLLAAIVFLLLTLGMQHLGPIPSLPLGLLLFALGHCV